MDRRVFLTTAFAAAATAAPDQPDAPSLAPEPPPPPGADSAFEAWKADFIRRALAREVPRELLERELSGLEPEPRVLALDVGQPELSKPFGDYIAATVTEARVDQGRGYRTSLGWWPRIEAVYGVPRDILIGVWAMESAFGAVQGDFDVIQALATLAADGRRRAWAEDQLLAALRILATMPIPRERLKGSWAGAMGQTQFIPQTYLTTAVDADGDGARDIWGSTEDAIASAANLLRKEGWAAGQPWHREVVLPTGFDYALAEGPRQPFAAWSALGVRTADRGTMADADAGLPAGLIIPQGWKGPALLVFPNHFVIRRYNNSTAYALAVGLLADRIGGAGPLVASWPDEGPLTMAQRKGAQEALAKLGFDPGPADGIIGTNSRAQLRLWQHSQGLPADGHLSPDLADRLIAAAAPPAPN